MQEKETITSNRYWWEFPALGWLFPQYLGRASVLRKQSPSRPENPICTGYWWKILIKYNLLLKKYIKVVTVWKVIKIYNKF